ncbi:MAG: SprT-like domain-containing protein [Desulfuromonadales bacterium]|nr:SprT-like domain-containing protein [Desulfuromonadales bacterium]
MLSRSVRSIAVELGVWEAFSAGVANCLDLVQAVALLERVGNLPVKTSHAVGLLGSYVHRGGEPLCIRLQPRQEPELLRTTLLHELAHACEHLTAPQPHRHRCSHGPSWRAWALAFGIAPQRSGKSFALNNLRQERLKPVAVCERCGCVFQRLRRLPARRNWVHPECGNGRVVSLSVDKRSRK